MAAAEQAGKGESELGGHGVVEQRIDGAVGVDRETATEQEPEALVATPGERVVDDEHAVRQPERRERRHHHHQHLHHLPCSKKSKGSPYRCGCGPYSITERRVLDPIQVLGSQPAGDVSHKPGGRLRLLSARPAVILAIFKRAATNVAAWGTEARWV